MNTNVERLRLRRILDSGNVTQEDVDAAYKLASSTGDTESRVIFARMKSVVASLSRKEETPAKLPEISKDAVAAALKKAEQTHNSTDIANYSQVKRHFAASEQQKNDAKLRETSALQQKLGEAREAVYNTPGVKVNTMAFAQASALEKIIEETEVNE